MYRACSRCGKIHDVNYKCAKGKISAPRDESRQARGSYAWQKKSEEIRKRADYLCEVCRANGRFVYDGLEVHHIRKVRDDPSALLDNFNLICLCSSCHHIADAGGLDVGFLLNLARAREEGDPPGLLPPV